MAKINSSHYTIILPQIRPATNEFCSEILSSLKTKWPDGSSTTTVAAYVKKKLFGEANSGAAFASTVVAVILSTAPSDTLLHQKLAMILGTQLNLPDGNFHPEKLPVLAVPEANYQSIHSELALCPISVIVLACSLFRIRVKERATAATLDDLRAQLQSVMDTVNPRWMDPQHFVHLSCKMMKNSRVTAMSERQRALFMVVEHYKTYISYFMYTYTGIFCQKEVDFSTENYTEGESDQGPYEITTDELALTYIQQPQLQRRRCPR
ncbi:hypothetical protein BDB00DRAFT_926239 [Zychaea mexicana]|uniref:uncharacterized protein n=1 Tax=Zychaea mexicana TaxID=64656 RepID=UPI0022FE930B|nr:uncharacterized protein BDB00DRAFT_926239 [Zychaea mexicana]KAI9497009.1 hypothetical protein BDB00DRAFT_926239 [Zychaea mexicana]